MHRFNDFWSLYICSNFFEALLDPILERCVKSSENSSNLSTVRWHKLRQKAKARLLGTWPNIQGYCTCSSGEAETAHNQLVTTQIQHLALHQWHWLATRHSTKHKPSPAFEKTLKEILLCKIYVLRSDVAVDKVPDNRSPVTCGMAILCMFGFVYGFWVKFWIQKTPAEVSCVSEESMRAF